MSSIFLLILIASDLLFEGIDAKECNERCADCVDSKCKECRYGWYGHDCNNECQNCWTGGCRGYSGKCHQCKPGRYKDHCRTPCPENCRPDRKSEVYCKRDGGKCLNGCREGWWGDTCNMLCSEHCESGACLQNNGHCIGGCIDGWWGTSCDTKCSEGCFSDRCEGLTGKCTCKAGFSGKRCNKKHIHNCIDSRYNVNDVTLVCADGCKPGYTSPSCSHTCGDNCLICHRFHQKCEMCSPPFYDDSCQSECSDTCQDYKCDGNGGCLNGCVVGFRGEKCDELCPHNCIECHRIGGNCTRCKVEWTGEFCDEEDVFSKTDELQ